MECRLLAFSNSKHVLIAQRKRGITLFSSAGVPVHHPGRAHQVCDVTGAGDSVVAILSFAACAGTAMVEAGLLANLGAGIVVGEVGTATVSREDMRSALDGE